MIPVSDGLKPLHRAAREGDWEALHAELSAGAGLDLRADAPSDDRLLSHEGATALHLAARGGHGAMVAGLIGRGVEVDARSAIGQTALHYGSAHASVVGTLLGEGADPNAADVFDAGAPMGAVDQLRRTAADWARDRGHPELAASLVDARSARGS